MADLQALIVMGCDFGQGVLVAPPMPRERFLELLRSARMKPRRSRGAGNATSPSTSRRQSLVA